jgi:hypothetical protein
MKQLDLFPKPMPEPRTRYCDLSINQRINVKANSCGFEIIWLQSALPWFKKHRGLVYRFDKPNELTQKWYRHHKINKNRIRPVKTTLL